MLLMPRKVKYRKSQKRKNRGIATTGDKLHFGEFGLKALENGLVRGWVIPEKFCFQRMVSKT